MARIPTYENKAQLDPGIISMAARRVEVAGDESGAAIQRGLGAVANGVQSVETHVAQNETSKLAADFATAQAQLTAEWNDTVRKADPNDHELADRFMNERVGPTLDKLGDGLLTTQANEMYTKAVAGLKADMFVKATADQSNLAGAAAVANLDKVKNQLSNLVRDDPTSYQGAQVMAKSVIEGLVQAYGLPREKAIALAADVNGQIAKSAAIGMADRNPDAAKQAIDRGDFSDYIDGTEAKTLSAYADEQSRAQLTAQKSAEAEQKKQNVEAVHAASNQILAGMIQPDGTLKVPVDAPMAAVKLSQMPDADPGEVRSTINMIERVTRDNSEGKNIQTDPHIYEDFSQRMLAPSSDPRALSQREVIAARAAGMMSDRDFSFFTRGIDELHKDPAKRDADRAFNAFLQSQKQAFTQRNFLTGQSDPIGYQKFFQFSQAARAQYEAAYASGNWHDVLDARNPAFLGRLAPHYLQNGKGATPDPVAHISGDGDFAKLPHGAQFVGPDGILRVKP